MANFSSSTQSINNGGSGLRKTNALFNIISQQQDIDEIYLYAKDQYEVKY